MTRNSAAIALCLGAVLLGQTARADDPPEAFAVTVTVDLPHLVLGSRQRGHLTFQAPADVETLSVTASVGRVEGLERTGPGAFKAEYVPPKQTFPQLAIITAAGVSRAGPARGFRLLPLWGKGDAVVHTAAGTAVSVRIGEELFGPVVADPAGLARVGVVVPPGVHQGFFGSQPIDLKLPAIKQLQVALDRLEVPADQPLTLEGRIYAVTENGEPLSAPPPVVTVSSGSPGAPRLVAPGVFALEWTLPPGAPGTATVAVRLSPQSAFEATAEVVRTAGLPARLDLTVDREAVVAGDGPLRLHAELQDAAGNPTDAPVRFSANWGALSAASHPGPGVYEAVVELPSRLEGPHLEVRAWLPGSLLPEAVASVSLSPGPAGLTVTPPRALMVGDGHSHLDFRLTVRDPFGNEVPEEEPPRVHALRGVLGEVLALGHGQYEVSYRTPEVSSEEVTALEIEQGGVATLTEVHLMPGAVPWASLGARLGVLSNFTDVTTAEVAIEAGAWTYLAEERWGLSAELGFFAFGRSAQVLLPPTVGVHGINDFWSLTLSGGWSHPLNGFEVRVMAGLGATAVFSAVALEGQGPVRQRVVVPTLHLSGELARVWGPGSAFAALRLRWEADPQLDNLRGALWTAGIAVGYRFDVL